ncbi:hypothetical protein [Actinomycetospora aeridis]|uniref:ARB-07466-like C-terminal domain-containing protein n=1 Tax=Actinomycetospora aeridis TaxID=3129231 RepID=A0ABU8N7J6_9PSEU
MPEGAVRGASRHRSNGRSAVRHGAVAAGLTGSALALVGPAVIALPDTADEAATTLELSAQGAALADAPSAGPARSAVAPVSGPSTGAASADLIKATERDRAADAAVARQAQARAAEQQRAQQAAAEQERTASVTDCGASSSYGGVADSVQEVGNAMECVFPGHDVLGVGSRGGQSDHPGGYALDFMTTDGDAIADCVIDNKGDLGVEYVIWNQRINTGSGWEGMEDRGGATANHEDHVHISFERGGSPDVSALRSCG